MPRPRARQLFDLGGQWIAEEPGRPGYYRYWTDAGTGRTRRASLGTADIEVAKERLANLVLTGGTKTENSLLVAVLENYFREKTDHLASKGSARNAGGLFLDCWGELVRVGSLSEDRVKAFVSWSLTRNYAISTVARNLGVLAAALSFAKLNVQLLCSEGAILSRWPEFRPKAPRRIFEPTDLELIRLLRAPPPCQPTAVDF